MSPSEIVQRMYQHDAFSQWLGIEILDVQAGSCTLQLVLREEMTNGFRIAHGGISYAFADSALAFAANTRGQQAVSVETSISHLKPVHVGDTLLAVATERRAGKRSGIYDVEVFNQHNDLVALFRGHVFRTDQKWE